MLTHSQRNTSQYHVFIETEYIMFSDHIANACVNLITLNSYLGFSPFRIDSSQGKVCIHFSSHCRFVHNWIWVFAYGLFVLPTHLFELLHTKKSFEQIPFLLILLLMTSVVAMITSILSLRAVTCMQILNAFFKFVEQVTAKYKLRFTAIENLVLEALFFAAYLLPLLLGILAFFDCLFRPFEPTYLLFGINPVFVSWTTYLTACCWYGSFAIGLMSTIGMVLAIGLVYFAHALPLLRNDLRLGQSNYRTSSSLREDFQSLIITWRSLEIFINIVNVELLFWLRYIDWCCKTSFVICLVTTIFHGSSIGLVTNVLLITGSVLDIIGWTFVLTFGGIHYKWSEQTIRTWRQVYWPVKKDWNFVRRTKLACKPFTFGNGRQFFMTPMALVVFWESVSLNTMTALLTYRDILGRYSK